MSTNKKQLSIEDAAHQRMLQQARELIETLGVEMENEASEMVTLPAYSPCATCGSYRNPHEDKLVFLEMVGTTDNDYQIVTLCPPRKDRQRGLASICERNFRTLARTRLYRTKRVTYRTWCAHHAEAVEK